MKEVKHFFFSFCLEIFRTDSVRFALMQENLQGLLSSVHGLITTQKAMRIKAEISPERAATNQLGHQNCAR